MIDIDQIAVDALDELIRRNGKLRCAYGQALDIIKAAIEKTTEVVAAEREHYKMLTQELGQELKLAQAGKEGDATCHQTGTRWSTSNAAPNVQPVAAAAGQEKWTEEYVSQLFNGQPTFRKSMIRIADAHNATLQQSFYYCNKCGYSGTTQQHEGCNYNAYPTPAAAAEIAAEAAAGLAVCWQLEAEDQDYLTQEFKSAIDKGTQELKDDTKRLVEAYENLRQIALARYCGHCDLHYEEDECTCGSYSLDAAMRKDKE